jgi:hypothetical protein
VKTRVVNVREDEADIYIGRPSKWGNPYRIGPDGSRREVLKKYGEWILTQPDLITALPELVGKRLGCWCAPKRCHGHTLVALLISRGLESTDE